MPSASDIAAGVEKSARHLEVEEVLAGMRARHDDLVQRQRALVVEDRERHGAMINRLAKEIEDLNYQMAPLRQEIGALREEHGARIAVAVTPLRQEAALKLLGVLHEERALRDVLDETAVAVERAGGAIRRMPPWSRTATEIAARIAGIKV